MEINISERAQEQIENIFETKNIKNKRCIYSKESFILRGAARLLFFAPIQL
jgi:hypothetical protein